MSVTPFAVLIVDDDPGVRASFRTLARSIGMFARSFASPQDLFTAGCPAQPGCLIIDVVMSATSRFNVRRWLADMGLAMPMIFTTTYGDVSVAVETMRQGAFDFLQKPVRDQALIDCVNRAYAREYARIEAQKIVAGVRDRIATLTTREVQVLQMMTIGKSNRMMAGEMQLSERTVEAHRSHMMRKMHAMSIVELVRMVHTVEQRDCRIAVGSFAKELGTAAIVLRETTDRSS